MHKLTFMVILTKFYQLPSLHFINYLFYLTQHDSSLMFSRLRFLLLFKFLLMVNFSSNFVIFKHIPECLKFIKLEGMYPSQFLLQHLSLKICITLLLHVIFFKLLILVVKSPNLTKVSRHYV